MRIIIYILIIIAAAWTYAHEDQYLARHGYANDYAFSDFRYCYEAGAGNFTWQPKVIHNDSTYSGWMYGNFNAIYWWPAHFLPFKTAAAINTILMTLAFLIMSRKVFHDLAGTPIIALILVVAAVKPFLIAIPDGNVMPLIALAASYPLACALAGGIKLYAFGIMPLHLLSAASRSTGASGEVSTRPGINYGSACASGNQSSHAPQDTGGLGGGIRNIHRMVLLALSRDAGKVDGGRIRNIHAPVTCRGCAASIPLHLTGAYAGYHIIEGDGATIHDSFKCSSFFPSCDSFLPTRFGNNQLFIIGRTNQ